MELTTIDFDSKTPDEIREMTEALRAEANKLKEQQDNNERLIREGRENVRKLIPNVTEFQEIANRRAEQLERRRRYERKILSIYNRFPSILNADQPQIISTDIQILNRQLELIEKREQAAKAQIAELTKKQERLEQVIVDLRRQNRLQTDLMVQRDQDKAQLTHTLKQELEASKTLYVSDGRSIERKTTVAENVTADLNNQLNSLKTQFETLSKQRVSVMQNAPTQNAMISQKIVQKQQDLLKSIDTFINWWSGRRMLRHYTDRQEFLTGVETKTQERNDQSYKSIEFIKRGNSSRVEELKSLQNMNTQLANSIKEKQAKRTELDERKQDLLKSFKPLPKDVDAQLKSLREQKIALNNRAKSLDIELQVLGVNGPNRAEARYEDARRHYRSQIQTAARLKKSIANLKQLASDHNNGPKNQFVTPLTTIQDSRLLLSEDAPYVVQAASLELLEKLVFNPANDDRDFYTGLLVFVHTEKLDMQSFVQALISFHNNSEYVQYREERLKDLVEIWRKWFPNDFQDAQTRSILSPLINLVGITGMYDVQPPLKVNVVFNTNVPFNAKETKIPFCASPLIIAEHFTYQELIILRNIQASEFVGCGWTSTDKWTKAPHIMKMTEHFNFISQWIVFSLISTEGVEERIALLERWIQIMDAAAEIVNFQLVFEIYAALCNPAITHLQSTWQGLASETMDVYRRYANLASPSARFANYRNELEKFPPETIVPYIGPFLTSLVYISDGNPSKKALPNVSEPVINFQKFRSYANVLNDIMVPWGKDMVFYLNEDLLKRIQNIPPVELSESELFQRSQKLKT
ncbi:RasGEF domain containing protein [Tritrichomonas foetus]|uniref:RasGEF domain containing protein n=1 Tax=Tritrichomonas foetus TaxID=1144522 RepID=A0A1J4JNV7_9EUKA|nr:RasGEF domain containing protein [Tritrichomonas foetus]|eukprot:OHS99203.1 RasGEF domain containing protein [Tritrichomonas foetus]